jgi:aspartate racemase
MHKRIGILGGISYESTKQYYELIHKKYYNRKHDYYFPEVVVFSLNFQ